MPTAAERDRLAGIFDRAAAVYDTVQPRFFRDIARGLVLRARAEAGSRVLDIGTGPGVVLGEIGRSGPPAVRLVGVDISAGMVREARARLSAQGIPAHVLRMDAERLGLADASFDLVTMSRAYLLPQRRAVLGEIRRVLRPGGRVAVAEFGRLDPRWAWTRAVYARALPRRPGGPGRPDFDAHTLQAELAAAGFENVQVESQELDVAFADLGQWWESAMSHGERGALELMDEDARRAFFELADPSGCLEADGLLHWRPELLYGAGTNPGPSQE